MSAGKMRYIWRLTMFCLAIFALHLTAAAIQPAAAEVRTINLSSNSRIGKFLIVKGMSESVKVSLPFSEIVVGDPEIADVNPLTDKSLYILGRKLGVTNIALFDGNQQLVGVLDVEVSHDLSGLRQALAQALPNNRIKVRSLNGRVLLQGTVPNAPVAERAMALAREFAGDGEAVSNSLSISANQQVNLEVRFVEVNRLAGKELGVSWNLTQNGSGAGTGTGIGLFKPSIGLGALSGSLPFGTIIANILGSGASPDLLISALEQKKLARRLAEPNLSALSGEKASFRAGGEFPVPVAQKDGEITIEFKEFGVKLDFTPVVLDDGLINLMMFHEVSEIDPASSVRLAEGGVLIPGISKRSANTTVELRDGQSFAIAGLLQSINAKNIDQVPWLGKMPVLGALFRSSSFQKKESDLVIIVTPRLVRPVGTREQLRTPTDNLLSSNEQEFFLEGKMEVSRKELDDKYHGIYGHIIDLPKVSYGTPNK